MCRLDVCQDGERQEDRDLPTLDVASAHAVAAGDDEEDGEDDEGDDGENSNGSTIRFALWYSLLS